MESEYYMAIASLFEYYYLPFDRLEENPTYIESSSLYYDRKVRDVCLMDDPDLLSGHVKHSADTL